MVEIRVPADAIRARMGGSLRVADIRRTSLVCPAAIDSPVEVLFDMS
jgi:hypothetical protein